MLLRGILGERAGLGEEGGFLGEKGDLGAGLGAGEEGGLHENG